MTLPGQEDGLLFQKKKSDMPDLEPMVLMHLDGTEVHFIGAKMPDDPPYLNRIMFKPNTYNPKDDPLPVVIWYDDLKRHQYWACSCGGTSLPFHLCKHLQTLEIVPANFAFIMTLKEYQYIIVTPMEDINFEELGDELSGAIIKHFPTIFEDKQKEPEPVIVREEEIYWSINDAPLVPVLKTKRIFADKDEEV